MKNAFEVRVLSHTVLEAIEGFRSAEHYRALLDAAEFGDSAGMGEEELREMCLMALQDLEPAAAAAMVLGHDLGDRLNAGQIRNLANEMLEEKSWEEYADMALHERLFNVGSLLYAAFPKDFPKPDAVCVELEVRAANDAARDAVSGPLHESFVVRLLADGMHRSSALYRLFDEQLEGRSFPEADSIVWIVQAETVGADTLRIRVVSSGYWLDALADTDTYESSAYADPH